MPDISQIEINNNTYDIHDASAREKILTSQEPKTVFAAPSDIAGIPGWRSLTTGDIPSLDASKIGSGTLSADRIPSLAASKIGSGTLSADRIPSLAASKIGSGTLSADRIPSLAASKIGSGTVALARGGTASDNTARAINTVFAGPSSGSAGNASWRKLATADLPTVTIAKGGTGKTTAADARVALGAAKSTWTSLGTFTGTNSLNINLTNYNEVCITCYYGTSYMGSIVLPKAAIHATTQRETYLTGSYNGSGTAGRMAACKLSQTKITGVQIRIDSTAYNGNWQVYAR